MAFSRHPYPNLPEGSKILKDHSYKRVAYQKGYAAYLEGGPLAQSLVPEFEFYGTVYGTVEAWRIGWLDALAECVKCIVAAPPEIQKQQHYDSNGDPVSTVVSSVLSSPIAAAEPRKFWIME